MERKESTSGILNLMIQPAFTVKDGVIDLINEAAQKYMLEQGTPIGELLRTGSLEYSNLEEGCLYLTLSIANIPCGASVRRMEGFDLFTLEQEADQTELQAMALAAQELRSPLSNVMTVADQLFPVADDTEHPQTKEQIARINRGLFQMLRIVSNMSDAYRYTQQTEPRMEMQDVTAVVQEVFDESAQMLRYGNTELVFVNEGKEVYSFIDREKLERAIRNMISNAVKFSQKGSPIHARLLRKNDMLYLSVQDSGSGMEAEQRMNVHARFRRQPGLEDSRFGIGLGMVLIRTAAAIHGGTVLIDHPNGKGTRVTLSMAIRQKGDNLVRAHMLTVDYAGERNYGLVELSEVLPAELYQAADIN